MTHSPLTPEDASRMLEQLGYPVEPASIRLEQRDERWMACLPEGRMAWFAPSDQARVRLENDGRVLQLLAERCSFEVPRVLAVSRDGTCQMRSFVPGDVEPFRIFLLAKGDPQLCAYLGAQTGRMLAEQHTRITAADVKSFLPQRPEWPFPGEQIRASVPQVVCDAELCAQSLRVFAMYEEDARNSEDRVLVHSDVGFHNMPIDSSSYRINGLIDYDGAACADRHYDFRYLVFDLDRYEMLEAAIAEYEPRTGCRISVDRVLLYNAASAISYLAYRLGTPAEANSCGRTLEEDLRWTRHAVSKVLNRHPAGPR